MRLAPLRIAPVKIAHVDAELGWSGGEVQVFLLMEGLARRGHEVLLLCPPGSRSEAEARARGIDVRAVAMRNDLDLAAVLRLRRALAAEGADLVHLHTGRATWLGGLAARSLGLPAVTTRRMDREVKRNLRNRLVYGALVRRAVAISPGVEACLAAGGVRPERRALIPSTVDAARLVPARNRADVRRAEDTPAAAPLALAVGALVRRKGLDVLLDAFARLAAGAFARRAAPDEHGNVGAGGAGAPHLWIAGEGAERAALERRIAELGLGHRARLLGRREDVADLLGAADVFVLPSRREGLGIAALEAMAAGRAVVASRVGGLADAVEDGRTGLLVAPEDPAALAAALARVLGDAALRERFGSAGRARVLERFRPELMVGAYEDLYAAVLAEVAGERAGVAAR